MPNGGTGVCGNCLNNMLRGAPIPYVGYCRIHHVPILSVYWTTCKKLTRWGVTRQEWEQRVLAVWQKYPSAADWTGLHDDIATYTDPELIEFLHLTAPLSDLLAAGSLEEGVLYSTDNHQPLPYVSSVDELEADPETQKYCDAVRRAIELEAMSRDVHSLGESIEVLARGEGPLDVVLAVNGTRRLTWQQAPLSLIRRAYAAVLAALSADETFRRFHQSSNPLCSSLYLGWRELPDEYASKLPPIPEFCERLADERLRGFYEKIYAPDRLPATDQSENEDERQTNYQRDARLAAIYCREALKPLVPTLPVDDR
jgi:hypothetical protein